MSTHTLITGPTSGIGLALAEALAAHGEPLLLVARRADALAALAADLRQRHGVEVIEHACDLADAAQVEVLAQRIERQAPGLKLLINNAGFATCGAFDEQEWRSELDLLQVNVVSLARLCHAAARRMKADGGGQILNVSSVSGFMPGPWMSNYAASKAYVLHFSEGLREELAAHKVGVSVLCPGTTRSPFFGKAGINLDKIEAGGAPVMTPEAVARITLAALPRNPAIIVPRWINRVLAVSPRFGPRSLLRKVVGRLYRDAAAPAA